MLDINKKQGLEFNNFLKEKQFLEKIHIKRGNKKFTNFFENLSTHSDTMKSLKTKWIEKWNKWIDYYMNNELFNRVYKC